MMGLSRFCQHRISTHSTEHVGQKIIMSKQQRRIIAQNITLLFGSLLFCFFVIEMGYRVLDPFPFSRRDNTEGADLTMPHLTMYDSELGWKGVPKGRAEYFTLNNRVWIALNADGFRDLEYEDQKADNPAIVFLGDSFTWGYEVEFEEMFVTKVRNRLPAYEILNLAYQGYGTDQELLTFKRWRHDGPLKLVVLMFCENDVEDNNSLVRYNMPKPRYKLVENELMLTGVPVPKIEEWMHSPHEKIGRQSWRKKLGNILFYSHFIHDVYWRASQFLSFNKFNTEPKDTKRRDDLT